ncbi:MAG: HAMP domain-containing protein [Gemmatimonadota bacterium]|nr:MAG: HAMP domain-containing protein [Gemmatimonadota bacterium]
MEIFTTIFNTLTKIEKNKNQNWIVLVFTATPLILLSIDVAYQHSFLSIVTTILLLILYIFLLYMYWRKKRVTGFRPHRYFLPVILLLLAVPLGSKIHFEINSYNAKRNWESLSRSSLRKDAETIRNSFQDVLRSAEQLARNVADHPTLKKALGDPNIENRATIFQILSDIDPEFHGDYGLEVFDKNRQSVAWRGVTFPPQELLKQHISIVTGQIYTTLCVGEHVLNTPDGQVLGSFFVYRPLRLNIPIQIKSLRQWSFEKDVSANIRAPFRLDFITTSRDNIDSGVWLPSDNEEFSVTLSDLENNTLGVARLSKPSYESYMRVQRTKSIRISILFLGLIFVYVLIRLLRILYFSVLQERNRHEKISRRYFVTFCTMTIVLWTVRYGLLFIGFPAKVLTLSIFDPIHYASPFFLGISRSAGELLITLIVLIVNIYLGWRLFLFSKKGTTARIPSRIFALIAVLPIVALIHFLFETYISGIRSLAHDSTLSFFNYLELFSSLPLLVTMTNLFLLSLATLSFSLLGLCLIEHLLRNAIGSQISRWTWIFFAYSLAGALWLLATNQPTYLIERMCFILALLMLASVTDRFLVAATGNRWVFLFILTGICAILSFPIFRKEIMKEEDLLIRQRTVEALQPTESWIRFVLENSLDYFGQSMNIQKSLADKEHINLASLAFVEWARSPLSHLNFGSSITILDEAGSNVSQFDISTPVGLEQTAASVLQEIEDVSGKFITLSRAHIEGQEIDLYSGATPVFDEGKLYGAVIVNIPVAKSPWGALTRLSGVYPTPLRPFEPGGQLTHKYGPTELVVAMYERETLVESTAPAFIRGRRPSEEILNKMFDEKIEYLRICEKIGDRQFVNFYFPQKGESVVGMVSVGYGKAEIWTIIHDCLRLLFTYLLLIISLYGLYRISVVVLRGNIRGIISIKRFQDKLLLSFAMLIIFPMLVMAFLGRNVVLSQQEDWIRSRIEEDLTRVRALLDEETITAAREIASNPEIIDFLNQPEEHQLTALRPRKETITLCNAEGDELWSNAAGRASDEIRDRVRFTYTPRVFYSHAPFLAIGSVVPIIDAEKESEYIGSVEYLRPIDDALCKRLSQRVGRDINVYHRGIEIASTRPELFQSEFLMKKLLGDAFLNIELLDRKFFYAKRIMGTHPYIEGYQPLRDILGRTAGVLSIPTIYQEQTVQQETAKTISVILVIYGLVLCATLLVGLILSRRISSPVRELTKGTRQIASGDLSFRIEMKAKDELGDLVASFNKMTEDLRSSQQRLVQAEKDAAWREMARQVAHEVKNPLTPMKLSIQHLVQAYKDKAEHFEKILSETTTMVSDQIDVLRNIASEFSLFARLPKRKVQACQVQDIMQESLRLFSDSFTGITLVTEYEKSLSPILADPEELQRVFVNLIQNAIQAMQGGGTLNIEISTQRMRDKNGEQQYIIIRIIDTGCGIPDDQKEKLFEPSFSTKTDGTGLGLAICKRVIDDLGGNIDIDSTVNVGTKVTLILPVHRNV